MSDLGHLPVGHHSIARAAWPLSLTPWINCPPPTDSQMPLSPRATTASRASGSQRRGPLLSCVLPGGAVDDEGGSLSSSAQWALRNHVTKNQCHVYLK